MTIVINWPRTLFVPRECNPDIEPQGVAGPPSLSGSRQTVSSPAAAWRIRYVGVNVHRPRLVLLWRAHAARIEGRTARIVLPVHDRRELRPFPGDGPVGPQPHSDGTWFSDGSGYDQASIEVRLAAVLSLRATTASVIAHRAGSILPGMHFSIGERLYRVTAVTPGDGLAVSIEFLPPAREPAIVGAALEFERPVCRVRLAVENGMSLALAVGRHGMASVDFIEDPN